jgi:succinylglutamate desuccinylase
VERHVKIASDPAIPSVVHIITDVAGPRAVMFCGIHGDEVSSIHALEKLFFDLFGGKRELLKGTLTLARGNEQAFETEQRYIKHNMNRMFRSEYGPEIDRASYEFKRTQELKPILHNCDYFLDFHSAPIAQEPFLVAEQHAVDFFRKLGIPKIMMGWNKFAKGPTGGDAENYANAHGALAATLESGSHFDKRSNDVAYAAAVTFLTQLGMIKGDAAANVDPVQLFDVYKVVTKEFADFKYADGAKNFQFIKKGEAFAFQNGEHVKVLEDSYLLIPMKPEDTKIHEEVCYLGRMVA